MPSRRSPTLVAFILSLGLPIALVQLDVIEYTHDKMGGTGRFDGGRVTGIPAIQLA